MQVKCPKCRFRFEENIPLYVKEAACACPRCGTPFLYVAPYEAAPLEFNNESDDTTDTPNTIKDKPEQKLINGRLSSQRQFHAKNPHVKAKGKLPYTHNPAYIHNSHPRERKGHKYLSGCLISFITVSAVLVLLLGNHILADSNTPNVYMKSYQTSEETGKVTTDKNFREEENTSSGKVPTWIQGKWIAHTNNYNIVLIIDGSKITEIDDNYTASGTFFYKNNRLICHYGKNSIFTYKLDTTSKTIDCGKGIIMHKIH